ncbi:hypothetical protein Tco_0740434, partial [Tanacetum coccineum]
ALTGEGTVKRLCLTKALTVPDSTTISAPTDCTSLGISRALYPGEPDLVFVTPPKSGSSGIVTLGCYFKYNKQDIGNDQEWTF